MIFRGVEILLRFKRSMIVPAAINELRIRTIIALFDFKEQVNT